MKKVQTSFDGSIPFKIASFITYHFIAIPLVFLIGIFVYGFRVKGRKNVKGYKNGLIAANHCQFIEPGFSGVAFWPRKILFSAEEYNAVRKDIGWLTRLLRTFGIPEKAPMSIAGYIRDALNAGWLIHFYPEGELHWRSQEPGEFMDGVFFFAFLNNVPVFPVTEVLKERPIRKIFPWWPPQTTFYIGKPVFPDDFRREGLSRREQVHNMSEYVKDIMYKTIEENKGCKTLPERKP